MIIKIIDLIINVDRTLDGVLGLSYPVLRYLIVGGVTALNRVVAMLLS